MMHRIRLAMHTKTFVKMGGRVVVARWRLMRHTLAGQPGNKHLQRTQAECLRPRRGRLHAGSQPEVQVHTGRGTKKTPVFGMIDRKTRQVRAHVIPEVKREILMDAILE